MESCDVAVIGAGPYGLSAAAHLKGIKGLDVKVFGRAMSFWDENMPAGMFLRSPYAASHLSDPTNEFNLDVFQKHSGPLDKPIPLYRFVDYGRWFQLGAVPDLDCRQVSCIDNAGQGFRLITDSGQEIKARAVVAAAGIGPFANIPEQFRALPTDLCSHTSAERDFARFAGKKVLVVGGGQSALESAALLHETGADVQVVLREHSVRWLVRSNTLHQLGILSHFMYSPADVGPAGLSRLVATPDWYRRLPHNLRQVFRRRCIRPAGSFWLKPRVTGVPFTTGRTVQGVSRKNGQVCVRLDDGAEMAVDHVLLGTGYRVDVSRYGFLSRSLLEGVQCLEGFPRLDSNFQSSVSNLYFIGAPAGWSFGPLMQFVAGASFASSTLARHFSKARSNGRGR
jgi:FAD-dependent urate hydroxylase